MASNPFSLGRLIGFGILISVLLALALPMVNYEYQAYGTTSSSNIICTQSWNNATANQNISQNQWTVACLGQEIYGTNYSFTGNSVTINGVTEAAAPGGYVFNLTNLVAFPKNTSNTTGGLNAGSKLQNSIGLAFVFAGIGTLIQTVENSGAIFSLVVGSLLGFLPGYAFVPVTVILKLFVAFIAFRMIILGISAWGKFDLWNT